jgi:hypothetical protein
MSGFDTMSPTLVSPKLSPHIPHSWQDVGRRGILQPAVELERQFVSGDHLIDEQRFRSVSVSLAHDLRAEDAERKGRRAESRYTREVTRRVTPVSPQKEEMVGTGRFELPIS